MAAAHAVHAQAIAVVARGAAADALIASGRGRRRSPPSAATGTAVPAGGMKGWAAPGRGGLYAGCRPPGEAAPGPIGWAGLAGATVVVVRHASVRSVWFLNSLRGALALAAAVAVADLSSV